MAGETSNLVASSEQRASATAGINLAKRHNGIGCTVPKLYRTYHPDAKLYCAKRHADSSGWMHDCRAECVEQP